MSDMGELIAVGLLSQPNASGLTANQAHEIGERVASRVAPLDAAWAEAEAALPEGTFLWGVIRQDGSEPFYQAEAWQSYDGDGSGDAVAFGPTPAAALRALAAKLRERAG